MSSSFYYFLILLPMAFCLRKGSMADFTPYCSNEALMESEIHSLGENLTLGELPQETWWSTFLKMSLNETACFFIKQNKTSYGPNTILHTLKYARLEHHYAISETYQFGLPIITPKCKCDCPGAETICSVDDYKYKNCTEGKLCYRTHHAYQSNSGCLTSGQSELCCQIQIDPYKDWKFKAVKLRQPDTFIVLHYRIYVRRNGKWKREFENSIMRIPLNTGVSKVEQDNHSIHLSVGSGRPHRQVEPGMYFWDLHDKNLRGNVLMNEASEKSLDKLGWFRWENDNWIVHQGLEKITRAQHVSVKNCKEQSYRVNFEAEQYILMPTEGIIKEEPKTFNLGTFINDEKWVNSVELGDRFVNIIHGEGAELSLNIKTKTKMDFIKHSSEFSDFNGTIYMDSSSNCQINLTFYEARGTLIGEISVDETLNEVQLVFSVQIGEQMESIFESSIAAPPRVNSRRRACIWPAGDPESQKCSWLEYEVEPMRESNSLRYFAIDLISECPGCNERGIDGFFERLDPRKLFLDGVQTKTDLFVAILEGALCLAAFILSILILTKCVIPMLRCLICVARPLQISSSRKQLHLVEKF